MSDAPRPVAIEKHAELKSALDVLVAPRFGAETYRINALRAQSLWTRSSVRLLADLVAISSDDAAELPNVFKLLLRAKLASPSLFRSVDLGPDHLCRMAGKSLRAHRLLLIEREGLGARLAAYAHLLAHAITEQFHEPTVVVTVQGDRLTSHIRSWTRGRMVHDQRARPLDGLQNIRGLEASFGLPLAHVLYVDPPSGTPVIDDTLFGSFHRVIQLDDRLREAVDERVSAKLYPSLRRHFTRIEWTDEAAGRGFIHFDGQDDPSGPFFSSFIVSLVSRPTREPFRTVPVDLEYEDGGKPRRTPGWRIARDHCRAWFDRATLDARWASHRNDPAAFVREVLADPGSRDIAWRWARGVTNRSVGIGLSGGGASSYALVPLFQRLAEQRVPIDVVSGVSGGAFLGAYFCKGELDGLERAIRHGLLYQLGLLPNMVSAEVGRGVVDYSLQGTYVGQTDVRFVPVTVQIPEEDKPRAHCVVSGTLGEAVQASGAAPVLFAPVRKRSADGTVARYADGAMAMLIPGRILRDHGADLVFAANCLPRAKGIRSLRRIPGVGLLYDHSPLGGLIDLWLSTAYMQGQLSRAVSPDVADFFEVGPEVAPGLRSPMFALSRRIVRSAASHPEYRKAAAGFAKIWKEFSDHAALMESIEAACAWAPPAQAPPPAARRRPRKPRERRGG